MTPLESAARTLAYFVALELIEGSAYADLGTYDGQDNFTPLADALAVFTDGQEPLVWIERQDALTVISDVMRTAKDRTVRYRLASITAVLDADGHLA